MSSPFEDLAFLASSEPRVRILRMLDEEPRTRTELQEVTAVSRKTVGRTLGEFTDRNWARRDGPTYEITPLGAIVAEDIDRLYDTLTTAQKLRNVIEYLPAEEVDFDLRRLDDARLWTSTSNRPDAALDRGIEMLDSTEQFRFLTHSVTQLLVSPIRDRVVDGGMDCRIVLTGDALEFVTDDPELAALHREIVDAGGTISRYDGHLPATVALLGEIAGIGMHDKGIRQAVIETDDRAVRTWAEDTFEAYEHDAEPVTADAFAVE
jgi:predicted transcriptional regulator